MLTHDNNLTVFQPTAGRIFLDRGVVFFTQTRCLLPIDAGGRAIPFNFPSTATTVLRAIGRGRHTHRDRTKLAVELVTWPEMDSVGLPAVDITRRGAGSGPTPCCI